MQRLGIIFPSEVIPILENYLRHTDTVHHSIN